MGDEEIINIRTDFFRQLDSGFCPLFNKLIPGQTQQQQHHQLPAALGVQGVLGALGAPVPAAEAASSRLTATQTTTITQPTDAQKQLVDQIAQAAAEASGSQPTPSLSVLLTQVQAEAGVGATANLDPATASNVNQTLRVTETLSVPGSSTTTPAASGSIPPMLGSSLTTVQPFAIELTPNTGNSIALFGGTKAGKTYRAVRIYDRYFRPPENDRFRNFVYACVFTNSPNNEDLQGHFMLDICNRYAPVVIDRAAALQVENNNAYSGFLFFLDDVIDHRDDRILKKVILYERNQKISLIANMQYYTLTNKGQRCNFNQVLIMSCRTPAEAEIYLENYLETFLYSNIPKRIDQVAWVMWALAEPPDQPKGEHRFIHIDLLANKMTLCRKDSE